MNIEEANTILKTALRDEGMEHCSLRKVRWTRCSDFDVDADPDDFDVQAELWEDGVHVGDVSSPSHYPMANIDWI